MKKDIFVKSGYAVYEHKHAIENDFSEFRYFIDEEKLYEMQAVSGTSWRAYHELFRHDGKGGDHPREGASRCYQPDTVKLTPTDRVFGIFFKLWMESENFLKRIASSPTVPHQQQASVKILKETKTTPPAPRHAASHRRRNRSRASAGRRQPRTDHPLREKDPGHPRPRLGRGRTGPGGGVSHGRSRRTGQLPAALL